jgi:hypothetical protein
MDGKHVVSKHGSLPPEPYPRHSESVLATAVYMPTSAMSIGIEYYLDPRYDGEETQRKYI